MAGIKISALPALSAPIGADVIPIVQNNVTYKTSVDQLIDTIITPGNIRLATTTALTATYNNGASGVGATLTNAGALAALSLDGVLTVVGDRVLIKDQASTFQNGVYIVTTVGNGATAWVLTRTSDYDSSAEIDAGDFFTVYAGTVNAKTQWIQTQIVTTVGTDSILFESNVVAGVNVLKTNNTISATGNMTTVEVTGATQNISVLIRYITNRGGGVAYTLPAVSAVGDVFSIVGKSGIWSIAQGAGQQMLVGSAATTPGAGGSLTAAAATDSVKFVCITADTVWQVEGAPQTAGFVLV